MSAILAYVDLTIVGYVAVFVATLVFSQKIKDFLSGVPADMRSGFSSLEASVKADVKSYQAAVIAKLTPPPPQPVAPAPAPAPAPVQVITPAASISPAAPAPVAAAPAPVAPTPA